MKAHNPHIQMHYTPHAYLGAAEIAQLELVVLCVDQQVLRLDVPVADGVLVYVAQCTAHLVRVQLDKNGRHALVVLGVGLADPVHLQHGDAILVSNAPPRQASTTACRHGTLIATAAA